MWWPGPGWEPWDDLLAAGIRVTADIRNVALPCAFVEIDSVTSVGGGGCGVYDVAVKITLLAPAPDTADSRKWLWTIALPPLLPHITEPATAVQFSEDSAAVETMLLVTHKEGL